MRIVIVSAFVLLFSGVQFAYAQVCPIPDNLGETTMPSIGLPCGSDCEPTLTSIVSGAGYSIDVAAADLYQVWDLEESRNATMTITQLAHYSGDDFVFGYYLGGDLDTFTSVFKTTAIAGYESVPLGTSGPFTINLSSGESVSFAARVFWGSSYLRTMRTNPALQSDGTTRYALTYDSGNTNEYIVAFEDTPGGDYDYNDTVSSVAFTCDTPECELSASESNILQGASTTLSWVTNHSLNTLTDIGAVSQTGSAEVSPDETTTYTLTTGYDGEEQQCQATVVVTSVCTLGDTVLADGDSYTFYSQPYSSGDAMCASFAQTRTCNDGVLSGSASYLYANCACVAQYTCSGDTIQYTNTACETTTVTSCESPYYCASGASSCSVAVPSFSSDWEFGGGLRAQPIVVAQGDTTQLYWDVDNADTCVISGDNGDMWTTSSSGIGGVETGAITKDTRYTLVCTGLLEGVDDLTDSVRVRIVPQWEEF